MIKTIILSVLLASMTGSCFAGEDNVPPQLSVDPAKALVISGPIGRGNILPIGKQLIDMANAGETSVDLIISSPGGEVTTGFLFLNMMETAKESGLHIRCFVPTVAASMAFSILVHCDERHILDKSFLLWHRAAVTLGGGMFSGGTAMRSPELAKLAEDLAKLDQLILREVSAALQIDGAIVSYHFDAQTLHTGSDLAALAPKFCQTHTSIPGVFEALLAAASKQTDRSPEDKAHVPTKSQYQYIWTDYSNFVNNN